MATSWYYSRNGTEHGPITPNELKRLAEGGEVVADDLVRKDGMEKWIRARQVKGLFATTSPAPVVVPAPQIEVSAPQSPAPPSSPAPPPDQSLVLGLYDLLRNEPVFVDWYLSAYHHSFDRWSRCEPPAGALWSRWGVTIVISWIVGFSGVGLAVTIPTNIYLLWRFHSEQQRYKEWRRQVDEYVHQIGLSDALALMERAPKVQGFAQFLQYTSSLVAGVSKGGTSYAEQDDS